MCILHLFIVNTSRHSALRGCFIEPVISRARICKRLRSPEIDFKESIPGLLKRLQICDQDFDPLSPQLLPASLTPVEKLCLIYYRRSRERHERPSCSKFATGINDTNSHSLPVSLTAAMRLELQIFSQIFRYNWNDADRYLGAWARKIEFKNLVTLSI